MDFDSLTDEEYEKICNSIPHEIITKYFKQHPKGLAEIFPGFRPNKITHERAVKLLIKFRPRGFISLFIEKTVGSCIKAISEEAANYQKEGKSEKLSYINALSHSLFSDNASAFFKLAKKDFSGEEEDLTCEIITLLQDYKIKFEKKVNTLSQEFESYKTNNQSVLREFSANMKETGSELDELYRKIDELQEAKQKTELLYKTLKDDFVECKHDNVRLIKQNDLLNKRMASFENALKGLVDEKNELATSVSKILEEGCPKKVKSEIFEVPILKPVRPKDMKEFEWNLKDNFESINVEGFAKDFLTSYISSILFNGNPIICDSIISESLIGCIANALLGTTGVSKLSFSYSIDKEDYEKVLYEFLTNSGRIVVLSNFLGHFDDTVLINMIRKYKNKIIFLTHNNSKTLKYLPDDLFSYCYYIGLTKIPKFSLDRLPDEDSYRIEEQEYDVDTKYFETRDEKVLRKILKELGYNEKVINFKTLGMENENRLCERLAFDIIPYWLDVFSQNPLKKSQKLQRVIDRTSLDGYRQLWKEWFRQ